MRYKAGGTVRQELRQRLRGGALWGLVRRQEQ